MRLTNSQFLSKNRTNIRKVLYLFIFIWYNRLAGRFAVKRKEAPTMSALTKKEKQIYDYIAEKINKEGYSPTVRDISLAIGIKSTSTVHAYLQRLEDKGYIQKEQGKSRTLRIDNKSTPSIPVVGRVAAGLPILAEENCDGYIAVELPSGTDKSNVFALKVSGESMIEAGILNGDYVIVDRTPYAENGQIVVALIGDEATVKTFYKEKDHFRLQPENSTMRPIISNDVVILGRVIANLRFYK